MIQPLPRRFLIYLIALASSLISPLCHSGHENEKLHVLAQIRNPDLVRRDADGNITIDNRATRLVEAVLVEADIDYEIRLYPWARILQELSAYKNMIAYPMARTASRDSEMHWAGIIRPVDLHLYGLRSKEAELPQSLNEARNSSIGVIRDDISDDYLTAKGFSGLIRVNDLSNAITMLERGRFDLFPFEAHGVNEMLRLNNLPTDFLAPVVRRNAISTELYFVISNHTDDHVRELLLAAYQRLAEDGTYTDIMGIGSPNQLDC